MNDICQQRLLLQDKRMNKISGWHRLFLCLIVAWLVGASFLAVPKFKKYSRLGVGAGCYYVAKDKMLDKVQERFPRFNRKAYVKHAEYPKGKYVSNPVFGRMPADRLYILPQIAKDYKSIDFKPILKEMNLCVEEKVSRAKSDSLKRNIDIAMRYYGFLGLLPLFGLYLIGRFIVPWIADGFKSEG